MTDTDKIRSDLCADIDGLKASIATDQHRLDCLTAALAAHDRVVDLLQPQIAQADAGQTGRARRRNLNKEILSRIAAGPMTVDELVAAIGGVKPGQITGKLDELGATGKAEFLVGRGWCVRAPGLLPAAAE